MPIEIKSRRKANQNKKNRLKAYYNSNLHFCRSLYEQKLSENGYVLYDTFYYNEFGKRIVREFNLYKYLNYKVNSCFH